MKLPEIISMSNEAIASSSECYVATIGEDNYPHVATRSFCTPRNIFTSFISTNLSGNLAHTIKKDTRMSICVQKENSNITMIGDAVIVEDIEVKKKMWQDWFINHYPKGVYDKEYCVIQFISKRLSLWINSQVVKLSIDEIKKVQSMCGLMCDTCDFKTSHNCKGCLAQKGRPFWGECPVATCSMSKGNTHCGQCKNMPCETLKDFSYGNGEHCDNPRGARIEVLKIWNN